MRREKEVRRPTNLLVDMLIGFVNSVLKFIGEYDDDDEKGDNYSGGISKKFSKNSSN